MLTQVNNFEIECDDCGSHEVHKVRAKDPPRPNKRVVKMSEVLAQPKPNGFTLAVMTYTEYKYQCANCGAETRSFRESP